MAKPTEDRVPLTAAWNAIKSGNATLKKSPLFKPDILGPIGKYDQALAAYTKQLIEKDKLSDFFDNMGKAMIAATAMTTQQGAERDKIDDKAKTDNKKYAAELKDYHDTQDADMNKVCASITNYCAALEEGVTLHRALSEKMYGVNKQLITNLNKIRDDYKTKSTAIKTAMTKIDSEVLALEGQIRGIINNYAKIAIEMDHDDAADAVRELLSKF